jgi:hypothetical protein
LSPSAACAALGARATTRRTSGGAGEDGASGAVDVCTVEWDFLRMARLLVAISVSPLLRMTRS